VAGTLPHGRELQEAARSGQCADFARNAFQAEAVGPVRRELQGEQLVIERRVLRESSPTGIGRQGQQAAVIFGMPSSRAEQSMPKDSMPRTLAALIFIPGSFGADQGTGHLHAGATLGAPQTICSVALTRIDLAELQLVGIGMLVDR
jgi:hypothetical protein